MKQINKLLLILNLSLLATGCINKNTLPNSTTNNPSIQRPTTISQNQPSLGTPISRPRPRESIPTTVIPRVNEQTPHQRAKYGKTFFKKNFKLPNSIKETSGLIKVDGQLWTLNDSGGKAELYQISEKDGRILKTLKISNTRNYDWEDIAYDDTYVYIGDMGNNRGNRKNLKIYKIPRAALRTQKSVSAELISFAYSDQKDFRSRPQKNNYDCEAMVAYNGKLYLFSKNWQNKKTRLYELSTQTGTHEAKYLSTFNIQGMVTGASLNKEMGILLLTTYSSLLNVEVWAFTNYKDDNFFDGDKKQLNFSSALQGQVEGVTFKANYKAYLSSEAFSKYIFSFDASLYELDFSGEFE